MEDHLRHRFVRLHRAAWMIAVVFVVAGLATIFCGSLSRAYDSYSVNRDATNCRACHGDFRGTAPYISQSDGAAWVSPITGNVNLHDGHRRYMVNSDCNVCHVAAGRFPTYLGSSVGGTGFAAIGCLGCHGRAEPAAGGAVTGSGLRQHHYRNGVTECGNAGCHTDANPATFTTADEHTFPPYYGTPDATHPNKSTNPCNLNGTEGAIAPPNGLDNDGNNIYDSADGPCNPSPAQSSSWGRIKTLYR